MAMGGVIARLAGNAKAPAWIDGGRAWMAGGAAPIRTSLDFAAPVRCGYGLGVARQIRPSKARTTITARMMARKPVGP